MANKLKKTNQKQFERMISLLEKHPDVARGKGHFGSRKQLANELWEQFTVELNSIGPPTRSSQEWQRVWKHYKANLKRKLVNNKKNISATGGGPSEEISLSPLEQSVADLMNFQNSVAPSGRSYTNPSFDVENDGNLLNCQLHNDSAQPPSRSQTDPCRSPQPSRSPTHPGPSTQHPTRSPPNLSRRRTKKMSIEEERLNAIKTQTKNHCEILQTLKVLEKTNYKNYLLNKKTYELQKKNTALLEKQMALTSELHELEIAYKTKKLEMLNAGYLA